MLWQLPDAHLGALGDIPSEMLTGQRLTSLCRELVHHSRLQGHQHIIAMREAYLTNDHLCVVMDYASSGDLAEHLSRHVYKTVRVCRPVRALRGRAV